MYICRGKILASRQGKDGLDWKRQEGFSAQPFIAGSEISEQSAQALPQGWALRSSKKAARFSAKEKAYLDEEF